ncbi:MAG: HEAT repeat domain-containing protein [Candidatus Aminicenantes bacterium]|nr:HEAT repeat domain-containing protein [Candidatus Aminicenantes bacterium]
MKTTVRKNKAFGQILLLALVVVGSSLPRLAWTQSVLAQSTDSLDAILKDLAGYAFSEGVGAPLRLRAYVFAHKDDPAARQECELKLQAFLRSGATAAGKMEACRSLRLIASAASVAVLEELLARSETSDAARYALERIPGVEADRALLTALDRSTGDTKRGIISSLGERGTVAAVAPLARLAAGGDKNVTLDAVRALGKIDSPEAVRTLMSLMGTSKGALKTEAASGLILGADRLLRAGKKSAAAPLYDNLLAAGLPAVDRQAAFRGQVACAGDEAKALILKALAGKEDVLYTPAIAMVPDVFQAADIDELASMIGRPGLPDAQKVQLTAVIAGYPKDVARKALLDAADNPSLFVRLEALRSLEKAGDGTVVEFLATRAARATGAEQDAAREALERLKGADVDAALIEDLPKAADESVKAELVQAAGARRIVAARPLLMEMVKSAPPLLQRRAAQALRYVVGPADMSSLLALLFGLEEETAREAMQDVAAAVARTNPRPLARGDAMENLLAGEKDPKRRVDLLRVLGKVGDETALPLLRNALSDPDALVADAAVRAVADWPTIAARDDALAIARTSQEFTHRVLALRAYIRMLGLEPYRAPQAVVADLRDAVPLAAGRAEEKLAILALLPRFACQEALDFANSLAADESVRKEAQLAADRIRQTLSARNR